MKKLLFVISPVLLIVMLLGLTGNSAASLIKTHEYSAPWQQEKDKGIGPFQDVKLSPLNPDKVKKGMALFNTKCIICHELDVKKLGPPIRNTTKVYTPEFILNMIVNPLEMEKSNETIKALLKQYNNLPMIDQKITQDEALQIFDYLRSVAK